MIDTGFLVDDEARDLVTIQIPHAVKGITPVSLGYLDDITALGGYNARDSAIGR